MFERHFFVCTNCRAADSGMQSCGEQGGRDVLMALQGARQQLGLLTRVFITETKCLGPCPAQGTTIAVYPENVWYTSVSPSDVEEITQEHMVGGRPVERLRNPAWPG